MTVTKTSCQADTLEADPTHRHMTVTKTSCQADTLEADPTNRHMTVTKTSCQTDTLEADPTHSIRHLYRIWSHLNYAIITVYLDTSHKL